MAKTINYDDTQDTTGVYDAIRLELGIDDDNVATILQAYLVLTLSTSGAGNVSDVQGLQDFIVNLLNYARSINRS
tara:strand:- start:59 stop:283 length:225 start_codon:yes stop_codon:yes gene_type:complete